MDLWHPPADEPQLLEWWNPLLLASQAARAERCPWPIHIDEVMLMGRIDRAGRPAIWVYKHEESRGELYLDATGQAYRFTKTPNGRSLGRFTQCDVRAAIIRAGLPSFVQPVWYDAPSPGHDHAWPAHDDEDGDDEPIPAARSPRRRGHLTVIDGGLGRPLAG